MQIAFDILVLAVIAMMANRWRELEERWTEVQHPYLKQQNDELNIWLNNVSEVGKYKKQWGAR